MEARAKIADTGTIKQRAKEETRRKAAQDKLETDLINKLVEEEYYRSRPMALKEKTIKKAQVGAEDKVLQDLKMYEYLRKNPILAEKLIAEEIEMAAKQTATGQENANISRDIQELLMTTNVEDIRIQEGRTYLRALGVKGFSNKNVHQVRTELRNIQTRLLSTQRRSARAESLDSMSSIGPGRLFGDD
jgi:hypothetical protein